MSPRPKEPAKKVSESKKDESQERLKQWANRAEIMLRARRPFERRMRRALLLYSGQGLDKERPNIVRYVSPLAFTFVEAMTAHEVRAMSEFDITPVEDAGDAWKVPFLKDCVENVDYKTHWKSKRIQMIRMSKICGVSIGRVGHRFIEGNRKINAVSDEHGIALEWEEKKVPVYDDMFVDIVPPIDFLVDPNAMAMNDAMDCMQFHTEHIDVFREVFSDGRFHDVMSVEAGENDMVGIAEGFNHVLDEWIIWAFPFSGPSQTSVLESSGAWKEIGYLALPDDHKKLPFFSYHNMAIFADTQAEYGGTRTTSGELTTQPLNVRDHETFWTQGVPSVIEDLINIDTDVTRSAWHALDLAGQSIFLTSGDYSLDDAIPWQSGKQAIGAFGKVQVISPGQSTNVGAFDYILKHNFEKMVLATGIDPRNLIDTKQKTATESKIQLETSAIRIALIITFNEENGETLRGELLTKGVQQYYSKMEIIRLTGKETKEELDNFEEFDKKKGIAKKYRRIKSSKKLMEKGKGEKRYIRNSDFGVNSFLARPEYIRTSEIDIRVIPKRRAEQMDSIILDDLMRSLQLLFQAYPLTISQIPGQTPPIDPKKLPDIGEVLKQIFGKLGLPEVMPEPEKQENEFDRMKKKREERYAKRKSLYEVPNLPIPPL